MKWLDKLFDWFTPNPPYDPALPSGERKPNCPYCRGLGYDASGYTCTCVKEME